MNAIIDVTNESYDLSKIYELEAQLEILERHYPKTKSYCASFLIKILEIRPSILDFSKWGKFLPKPYQVSLVRNKYYDINSTAGFLKNVKLSTISLKNLY